MSVRQETNDNIIIVKISGKVMDHPDVLLSICTEIGQLVDKGYQPVVIHGGGKQVNQLAKDLNVEQTIVGGRRVTSKKTLDLAKMVFKGGISTDLTAMLTKVGLRAVGLSGVDGKLIQACKRPPQKLTLDTDGEETYVDFGFVGDVVSVDTEVIDVLLQTSFVPVVASLGVGGNGEVFNINADTIAMEIAKHLGAHKLVLLTDVNGIYRDLDNMDSRIDILKKEEALNLIESGVVSDGMIPKITSIVALLEADKGVSKVHVAGAFENQILSGLLDGTDIGTTFRM